MVSKTEKPIICDVCGKESAYICHLTRSYGKGAHLFVIENVPVVCCSQCGANYITAETAHEIARIKLHRKSFAVERPVAVAEFA
jgi:YgiT-type zinc finger domain-containing protein